MSQEQIEKLLEKSNPFKNVQSKVGEKMHMGASTAVVEIREQIAKEKKEKELNMLLHSSQQAIVNAQNKFKSNSNLPRAKSAAQIGKKTGVNYDAEENEGIEYLASLVKGINRKAHNQKLLTQARNEA